MKVIITGLFLFFMSIAFAQEKEFSIELSIEGSYPKEAIDEVETLYKNDQLKLKYMLEQIEAYGSVGVLVLSTKQYETVKNIYNSFPDKPSSDKEIAEIKRARSYLNKTYILVSEL